ncbi:hypothetical protein AMS68_007263 [Peltaster fructicola]|uniref:Cytochrome b5 heme-binding domain-containing protein n=1 Tax=Peltaster fructicola TaxID=286661 RepID=A0A6H0Y460_9PEZI|nr:hypothetical protein AMS68_007263 [Peltaster fructicola]
MPGFEPKEPVQLDPPKDDLIDEEYLAKCDGKTEGYPTYVAIKGTIFDVTGNKSYAPGASYSGKDASRALAQSSLKPEECRPDCKRYNIKGQVKGATNK